MSEAAALASPAPGPRGRATVAVPVATAAIAMCVYAATAARSITWWDGSSYPLAAATLGIPGSPGSLLLTLIGWLVCQIPVIHPVAFRLSLLAGAIAATLAGLVTWLAIRLATPERRAAAPRELFAGALAGLVFAFSVGPWTYAVQLTPYGLSALFTALILIAALAWWRRPESSSGRRELFLLFLLFGLDFSVHRTNTLLLPGALAWLALRHPGGPGRPGGWASAIAGLALGLSFHLLLIPIAARHPGYMVEDTSTLAGFWSYVTVAGKGGGFLVNLFPRTADLVGVQLADYLGFLRRNAGVPLLLPAILAAFGWVVTLREHPRRALGWLGFFLCAGLGAVVYFNLPDHYMRTMDRHYLPSLVVLAPWVGVGAKALLRAVAGFPAGAVLAPALALALAAAPVVALNANRGACDLSRVRFAEAFARDLLEPFPPGAILLTNGDNDTMPLWYMQQVEGVRTDVEVINLPLTNTGDFLAGLRRHRDFARVLEREPRRGVLAPWTIADTTIATVVEPRSGLGLPAGVTPPDSVAFHPTGMLLGHDRFVLDLFRLTRWRRPVFLAITVQPELMTWLKPYLRLDGMVWRVVPSDDPAVWDLAHLRDQLLVRLPYAGLAGAGVPMDQDTRGLYRNYAAALLQLAMAQNSRAEPQAALETLAFLERRVAPARLGEGFEVAAQVRSQIEAAIAPSAPGR
jgi:hypothetical protein